MNKSNSSIIAMAYPDSFVSLSNEPVAKITPYLGLGNKNGIKVGHAALCTVDHTTGDVKYYDFGRYITPDGFGRVRSVLTDHELDVPVTADIKNNQITNINEILIWLEAHPEKTHGEGVLVASVCSSVNKHKADTFIKEIHTKGSIPYGVFVKEGSNCVRFVHDTLRASCQDTGILRKLTLERIITPSPLGVVSKATSSGSIYSVKDGKVTTKKPYSTISSWKYFFDKPKTKKEMTPCALENVCHLPGVGSSAYFRLQSTEKDNEYLISRFTPEGIIDCENIFVPEDPTFDPKKDYRFVYDSNCDHCHIEQKNKTYRFNIKK